MSDVLEQVDFVLLEDELEQVVCESQLHREWKLPPHEAHWWAAAPCLNLIAVCDERRRKCRRDGAWKCSSENEGCSASHAFDQIDWAPVRGS